MFKKNCVSILLHLLILSFNLGAIDPFSHIKITSNKATCQKSKDSPHTFIFNYIEKVNVVLADGSTITADSLEIIFDSNGVKVGGDETKQKKHHRRRAEKSAEKSNDLSNVKQVTFKNNVHISNQNRRVQADSAVINVLENTCRLDGNIKIKQVKVAQSDIPLDVQSTQALINLKTSQVTLLGSNQEPVSTVIELSKNVMSFQKSQQKK